MAKAFLDIQIQWQQQSYRLAQESEFKFQIQKLRLYRNLHDNVTVYIKTSYTYLIGIDIMTF